jgi:hypothetical protein
LVEYELGHAQAPSAFLGAVHGLPRTAREAGSDEIQSVVGGQSRGFIPATY